MPEAEARTVRWVFIWVTILTAVVLVVIGFLLGIVRALESIDEGLFTTTGSVSGAGVDVKPLPAYIGDINKTLDRIDTALEPIPGQANSIIGELGSIRGNLASVDASLVETSGSLVNTSGVLADTSGMLVTITGSLQNTSGVLRNTAAPLRNTSATLRQTAPILSNVQRLVRSIRGELAVTQSAGSLGTRAIWPRVARANSVLRPIDRDTEGILAGLVEVNKHLESICQAVPEVVGGLVDLLGTLTGGGTVDPGRVRPGQC
ncbi:MAG: hypothetical protein M3133_04390 [Actinomycetota bacterium]|nr:hypothetical protein [Actinomycetota bacterium]